MKSSLVFTLMITGLVSILPQAQSSPSDCVCNLKNSEHPFPHDKLQTVENSASKCTKNITPQQTMEVEGLLLGLKRRLPQLEADVSVLEQEDDGALYGTVSLQVIENELSEIQQLIAKLNSTTHSHQRLNADTAEQLQELKEEMGKLEKFDNMQVVRGKEVNKRLRRDLDQCKNGNHPTAPPLNLHLVRLLMHSPTAMPVLKFLTLSSCSFCVSCETVPWAASGA